MTVLAGRRAPTPLSSQEDWGAGSAQERRGPRRRGVAGAQDPAGAGVAAPGALLLLLVSCGGAGEAVEPRSPRSWRGVAGSVAAPLLVDHGRSVGWPGTNRVPGLWRDQAVRPDPSQAGRRCAAVLTEPPPPKDPPLGEGWAPGQVQSRVSGGHCVVTMRVRVLRSRGARQGSPPARRTRPRAHRRPERGGDRRWKVRDSGALFLRASDHSTGARAGSVAAGLLGRGAGAGRGGPCASEGAQ